MDAYCHVDLSEYVCRYRAALVAKNHSKKSKKLFWIVYVQSFDDRCQEDFAIDLSLAWFCVQYFQKTTHCWFLLIVGQRPCLPFFLNGKVTALLAAWGRLIQLGSDYPRTIPSILYLPLAPQPQWPLLLLLSLLLLILLGSKRLPGWFVVKKCPYDPGKGGQQLFGQC